MSIAVAVRSRLDPAREKRLKKIEVAARMATSRLSVRTIAAFYGISRSTAYRYYRTALTFDDPEADALRGMIRDRGGSF